MSDTENPIGLAKDVWKNNRPFAIAAIVVVVAIIFILYKKNQMASIIAPSAAAPSGAIGPGGSITNNFTTTTVTNPTTILPGPTPGPNVPPFRVNGPGSTFLGPTGVKHYVATGGQTLSQIASQFGIGTWNSIYAIPTNQKLFGAMNATHAASYAPPSGLAITLPPNTTKGF